VAGHVENEVLIDAPVDLTWRLTSDVEQWPGLFSDYASVRLLNRDDTASRFRLIAPPDRGGRVRSWLFEQISDPVRRTVHARRVGPGPLAYLWVCWRYTEVAGLATRLRWILDFATRPDAPIDEAAMTSRIDFGTSVRLDLLRRGVQAAKDSP
jgi:aromatase